MDVGVADTAVRNLQVNVVRSGIPAVEGERCYRGSGALGSVAFSGKHSTKFNLKFTADQQLLQFIPSCSALRLLRGFFSNFPPHELHPVLQIGYTRSGK